MSTPNPMYLLDILGQASELTHSAPSSSSDGGGDGEFEPTSLRHLGQQLLRANRGFLTNGGFQAAPPSQRGHFKLQQEAGHQSRLLSVPRFLPLEPVAPSDLSFDEAFEATAGAAAGITAASSPVPSSPVSSSSATASSPRAAAGPKKKTARQPKATGRRTWKKPADKPRRPLSAYNLFFQAEREKIVVAKDREMAIAAGEDPDSKAPSASTKGGKKKPHRRSHGKIGFKALAQNIAAKWKTLDAETRKPFEEKAAIEKKRYRIELSAWEKKRTEQGLSTKAESQRIPDGKAESPKKKCRPCKAPPPETAEEEKAEVKRPEKRARHTEPQAAPVTVMPVAEHPPLLKPSSMAALGPLQRSIAKIDSGIPDAFEPINIRSTKTMMDPQVRMLRLIPKMTVPMQGTMPQMGGMSLRSMLLASQMRQLATPAPPPQQPRQQVDAPVLAPQSQSLQPCQQVAEPQAPLQLQPQPQPQPDKVEVDTFESDLDAIFGRQEDSEGDSSSGLDDNSLHNLDDSMELMNGALSTEFDDFSMDGGGGGGGGGRIGGM